MVQEIYIIDDNLNNANEIKELLKALPINADEEVDRNEK